MTLEELMAADEETKKNFGNRLYETLVKLYVDQYGNGATTVEFEAPVTK